MQIIVLGMHRAGTSAVTRLINLMGAEVGPSRVLGAPAFDNEKGFWERSDVSQLNEELLSRCDGSWDDVHALNARGLARAADRALRERAERILFELDTRRPWVMKDPRLCLTLPFWQPMLEAPIYVLPYRSPIEICRSLAARDKLRLSHALALWEHYSLSALEVSAGSPRLTISYTTLLAEPAAGMRALFEALEAAGATGLRQPHEREVLAFIDARLHHQEDDEAMADRLLNREQQRLAAALADGSALSWARVPALSQGAADVLEAVHCQRRLQRDGARQRAQLEQAHQRQTEQALAVERLSQDLAQRDDEVRSLQAEREQLNTDLAAALAANERYQTELTAAQDTHGRLQTEHDRLQTEQKVVEQQSAERAESVGSLETEVLERNAQLDQMAGELGLLSRWLADAERSVTATRESWRWRVGNSAVRTAERLLLRRRPTLAMGHLQELFQEVARWRANRALQPAALDSAVGEQSAQLAILSRSAPAARGAHCFGYSVLCLPIIDWSFRFQRPQQLARQFVRNGHKVYYVALEFGEVLSQRELEPGVTELRLPGQLGRNVYQTLPTAEEIAAQVEAIAAVAEDALSSVAVCVTQLPFWAPLSEALRERLGCALVYDCMDDHDGFATNARAMLDAESRLLREADLVVASSQLLFDKVKPEAQRALLVRNAAESEHFGQVPATAHAPLDRLAIGYYGAIAEWFDSALVAAVARMRPHWRLVLIGHTFSADLTPLKQGNISLPGEQPYADLPELIADWDCCLIPFRRTPLTEATNPVKVYEMLAAGKPVVAVPLPELLPIAEQGLIALAESAEAFVDAIEREVTQDSKDRYEARRSFAQENTWERRYQALARAVEACFPLVSVAIVTYNNLELNRQCLQSVLAHTDYPNLEIIVVDNGSSDGTPQLLRAFARDHRRLTVVLNPENKGFAAANNQALAIAHGAYLCLLNNDTVVSGRWLTTLVGHLQREPNLGLVGPVTNAIANEAQVEVGYEGVEEMPAWAAEYCRAHRGQLSEISMLAFFCVLMPRHIYEQVGPLDERFGLGMFEDDDYNARVREAGFRVLLAQDSFVHHWQRASFKLLGEEAYLRTYNENQRRYREKVALKPKQSAALAALHARCAQARFVVLFAPSIGWDVELFQRPHHLATAVTRLGGVAIFDCTGSSVDQVDLLREVRDDLYLFQGAPALLRKLPNLVLWTFTYNYGYRDYFSGDAAIIYDYIDDLSVFPYDQGWLAALHQRATREAEVVAAVARNLHQELCASRADALYLPNAVDPTHFRDAPTPNPASSDMDFVSLLETERSIAGYYGALARWFDYDLLSELCRLRDDWSFVLIGPDLDGSLAASGLTQLANLHWLGPRPYEALPAYAHAFDAAIIPFKINEITLATSPLKLFEYFAAGRGVVTTAMPECEAFTDTLIARTAYDFAERLTEAKARSSDEAYRTRVRALAEANSWSSRVDSAMRVLRDRQVLPPPIATAPVASPA